MSERKWVAIRTDPDGAGAVAIAKFNEATAAPEVESVHFIRPGTSHAKLTQWRQSLREDGFDVSLQHVPLGTDCERATWVAAEDMAAGID
jgi:hypothetical protein